VAFKSLVIFIKLVKNSGRKHDSRCRQVRAEYYKLLYVFVSEMKWLVELFSGEKEGQTETWQSAKAAGCQVV
jgi:hypothetical protein